MLVQKLMFNDADHFSEQLLRLQEALQKANSGMSTDSKPAYKETGSPICSPASSAIN